MIECPQVSFECWNFLSCFSTILKETYLRGIRLCIISIWSLFLVGKLAIWDLKKNLPLRLLGQRQFTTLYIIMARSYFIRFATESWLLFHQSFILALAINFCVLFWRCWRRSIFLVGRPSQSPSLYLQTNHWWIIPRIPYIGNLQNAIIW